jgi:hypothetical protein
VSRGATTLAGAAGEYFVAAELSRRGWLATVTIKNSPDIDVLACHAEHRDRQITVQVKTMSVPGSRALTLSAQDEDSCPECWQREFGSSG